MIDRLALGDSVADLCRQAGISASVFRRHRERLGQRIWSDAEWVLAALAAARPDFPLQPGDIAEWIDWRNHVRFRTEDIEAMLTAHEAGGRVRREGTGWLAAAPWP